MKLLFLKELFLVLLLSVAINGAPSNTTEAAKPAESKTLDHSFAEDILHSFEKPLNEWQTKKRTVDWNYETNLTDANLEEKLKTLGEASNYQRQVRNQITALKWQELKDENLKRQFCKLSTIGQHILPEKSYKQTEEILSKAERLYNTLTICDYKDPKKCNLTLIPDLVDIMAKSRDPEELKHIWVKWHDLCGKTMLPDFPKYVELLTEAAKLHNVSDFTVIWLKDYETDNFNEEIEALWQQVKPFYLQLHAYVRSVLRKQYGENIVPKEQPIPEHLLGDMWAEKWTNIANFSAPFADKKPVDVTEEMIKQEYDVKKMYTLAEESLVAMGMPKMPESFWEKSIFTKPADREIVCDSPPWDFNDGQNYRISKCNQVSMENLKLAYNHLGIIEYFMQYKDQRFVFKNAPNPGFREAIGDLIALSVTTPSHLEKIGLLKTNASDPEIGINNLYYTALDRVANLPFAYVTEKWRWDVFQNKISSNQYNCHWWKLSEDIQGVQPPVERTSANFDPGTEYHIAVDYTYLRYFVSSILQFQLHKSLCTQIGQYNPNDESKPLHLCDITASTEVGNKLMAGMKMGSSKSWQDVLEAITGERKMDASGLLEYFKPLQQWLQNENSKTKEFIGWTKVQKDCPK